MSHLSSTMSRYKHSRKALSLSDKLSILKVVDDNPAKKKVEIARQLNLPMSTLNTLISKRKEIEQNADLSGSLCAMKKRFQLGRYTDMEIRLAEWIEKTGVKNTPLNGQILIEKAKELAVQMNLPDKFAASTGWLYNFKLRFGLHNAALKRNKKRTKRKMAHRAKAWMQEENCEEGDHRKTEAECSTGTTSHTRETLEDTLSDQVDVKQEVSHLEELNAEINNSDQHLASVKIEICDNGEDVKSSGVQQELPYFVTMPDRSGALPTDVPSRQQDKEVYSFPFPSLGLQEPSTSQRQDKEHVEGKCKRNSQPQFQFVDVGDNTHSFSVRNKVEGKLPSIQGETAALFSTTLNCDPKPYTPVRIYNPTSPSTLSVDPVQCSQSSNSQLVVRYQPSHPCSPATVSEFCPADPIRTNGNQLDALSAKSHIGQTTHETSQTNDVQVLHRRIWELEMQIKTFKHQIAVRDKKKCGPLCQLISMETLQAHLLNTGFGAVMSQKSQETLVTSLFPNGCTTPDAVEQTRNREGILSSEVQLSRTQKDSRGNLNGTNTRLVTNPPVSHELASIMTQKRKQNLHRNKVYTKVGLLQAQLAKKYCYERTSIARKKAIAAHNMANREKKAKSALQNFVQYLNSRVLETNTLPSNST